MKRRSFLAALVSLPFVGRIVPAALIDELPIVRFRKVVRQMDTAELATLNGTVNSRRWHRWPARYWKCDGFDATRIGDCWEIITTFRRVKPSYVCGMPVYQAIDYNGHDFGERIPED